MIEKFFLLHVRKNYIEQHPELASVIVFVFATMQLVSLVSFSYISPEKNILGLFGYISAYSWYFLFGPIAYLGVSYFYVVCWNIWNRNFHSSPVTHMLSYLGSLFSLCMIACLFSSLFLGLDQSWSELIGIPKSFYINWKRSDCVFYFPFAGLPMKALYSHIPYVNLETLFNIVGTALVSSTTLFVSLTLLFDINIKNLFYNIIRRPSISPSLDNTTTFLQSNYKNKSSDIVQADSRRRIQNQDEESRFDVISQITAPQVAQLDARKTSEAAHTLVSHASPERSVRLASMPQSTTHMMEKEDTNSPIFDPAKATSSLTAAAKKPAVPLLKITEISNIDLKDYILPSNDLLNVPKRVDLSDLKKELKEKADLLEETLMSFGIEAKVGQIHCGPTVTMFEVHPAVGVKIGKIKTLENDLALNMEAKSIRIIAPIPGKAAVGIEVPNQCPQEVSFKEILTAYKEQGSPYKIPMLLGKSVNGELVLADLTKMPHCIIAGATGSGKSVCINSIVMSILMLAKPDEIRLLMIDPKKVELTPYTQLPHMLAPVITEPGDAALALNWLVHEMEKRYEILKLTGQRNIDSFNKRKRNADQEACLPFEIPEKLPYYVAIIDELADLMMISSQDIETPIARIAQMARAVGIHLILATQRPSREVITGLIKANFPARISFKVASRINSQIILDDVGAETLLGYGDMLFLLPGSSQPLRAQGVYVRDEEIAAVITDITTKAPTRYVIRSFNKNEDSSLSSLLGSSTNENVDSLFEDAKSIVYSTGNASTTFLQRKLKIGYARAASIMDELQAQGIVGPQEGAKPRKINFPKKEESTASSTTSTATIPGNTYSSYNKVVHDQGSSDANDLSNTYSQLVEQQAIKSGSKAPSSYMKKLTSLRKNPEEEILDQMHIDDDESNTGYSDTVDEFDDLEARI